MTKYYLLPEYRIIRKPDDRIYLPSISRHIGKYIVGCGGVTFTCHLQDKNVNVTIIMFLMSGDLTGLCLYIFGT